MEDSKLSKGFQEAPLSDGFEEIPLNSSGLAEGAEDVARGAAMGVTLGTAPLISGGVQALMEKIGSMGDSAPPEFLDLYRKYQKQSTEAFEKSQQRSPYLYGAGEIGGAIAPALLTSGAGLAASGARGAAELGTIAAAKGVAKEAAAGALGGAGMGAISGAATSKSNLIGEDADLGAVAKDAGKSGIIGATLGSIVSGGASAIGKLGSGIKNKAVPGIVDEYKIVRQMEAARQEGKAGRGFSGESTIDKRLGEEISSVEGISNKLIKGKSDLGENLKATAAKAAEEGKTIVPDNSLIASAADFKEVINTRKGLLGSQKTQEVNGLIDKLNNGSLNPAEAYELRKLVKSLYNEGDAELNNVLANFAGKTGSEEAASSGLLGAINDQIPEFSKELNKYSKFSTALETLKGEGYTPTPGYGYGIEAPQVTSKVGHIVSDMGKPGTAGEGSKKIFNQFINQLEEVEKAHPGTLETLGLNVKDLSSQIKSQADLTAIRKAIQMQEPRAGVVGLIEGTARGGLLKGANIAGKVQKALSPPEIAKRVYAAGDDYLKNAAGMISQHPKTKFLGESLVKALDNKDMVAKNAALFAIMQNPEARNIINSISDNAEEKVKEYVKPSSMFDKTGE